METDVIFRASRSKSVGSHHLLLLSQPSEGVTRPFLGMGDVCYILANDPPWALTPVSGLCVEILDRINWQGHLALCLIFLLSFYSTWMFLQATATILEFKAIILTLQLRTKNGATTNAENPGS